MKPRAEGKAEAGMSQGATPAPGEAEGPRVTDLLTSWAAGDAKALDSLMPLVFDQLRQMAASHLRHERGDHTLQPTALVNELYLRLAGRQTVSWRNRAHFLGFAAQAMRRILVDHARLHHARKRGGGEVTLSLEHLAPLPGRSVDVLALDDALRTLEGLNERQARVVELRFFVGLEVAAIAEVLGVAKRTVDREWSSARAWLLRELARGER